MDLGGTLRKGHRTKICGFAHIHLKICLSELKQNILYGQAKVHKPVKGSCLSFCPILLAIGTPTNDSVKFLLPILNFLTENDYAVHNSPSFACEVSKSTSNNLKSIYQHSFGWDYWKYHYWFIFDKWLWKERTHTTTYACCISILFHFWWRISHLNWWCLHGIPIEHLWMLFYIILRKNGFQKVLQSF